MFPIQAKYVPTRQNGMGIKGRSLKLAKAREKIDYWKQ